MIAGLGGGSSGNKEGWERSTTPSNVNLTPSGAADINIEPEEDDSYLFMGATAVIQFLQARRSAVGGAVHTRALLSKHRALNGTFFACFSAP